MKKNIFIFGLLITALLILFQLGKFQMFRGNINMELVIAIISIVFFFLGLYFRNKLISKSESLQSNGINYNQLKELGISNREQEVLQELVAGLTNKEIGEKLYVSESTVKTHVSSLYSKLKVNRRSQAILKAREIGIVENAGIGTKVP